MTRQTFCFCFRIPKYLIHLLFFRAYIIFAMDLLSISSNERAEILKHYDISEAQVKEDVELIKSWKQKQPHLPENISGVPKKHDFVTNKNLFFFR